MPGKSIHEAVDNYITPLRRAVLCLNSNAHIVLANRPHKVDDAGYWRLGDETGLRLKTRHDSRDDWRFFAEQHFSAVEADPAKVDPSLGKYRVTTTMYSYKLEVNGSPKWRMDWHPMRGVKAIPHMHIEPNMKAHVPTGRQTLENAVWTCIDMGAVPACSDWESRLLESDFVHKLHRSWIDNPAEKTQ
ncbi:hypothetical protein ACFYVD_08010 [Rhodococcus pyridinivorans]|uniref:hypothetical protein n=1 Tax=Rhodococcus pyridinivorans TaxID=103816 RepID=UPI0036BEAC00